MRGGLIEMGWLRQQFMVVPRRASRDILCYHARAYLLYVLECTIFCNSTGNRIHSSYSETLGAVRIYILIGLCGVGNFI
ncbi:hypothetical protein QJS10_CPA03g01004 [Acorus calamus]|uniref:Uncharacterized protein n=1 Tax=Acorus calamus TaxID=4465 RepID=A0AAV9F731_ACOCL|nr:hypothetical protein QJS10_CPA03g01004 [Acorus calamus]